LVSVSEGPEGAQRYDVAGGAGVEERLEVAEFLGVTVGGSGVTVVFSFEGCLKLGRWSSISTACKNISVIHKRLKHELDDP
jgi:hypothetical protein